ncbi:MULTISPECIES: hypothetical protein [unclassified Mesorhizobium]|uniref:hypothetical protein n=1 Tax=unclassified Mesorhizobium TaxID=325217 RepID=UPI0003CFD01C|nr:hypothetical protein [Mesorhizobium sp. L2C085B000]ESZ17733.1 hypothetical protein X735_11490 [Mesorhizobium sp. L2C085B000]
MNLREAICDNVFAQSVLTRCIEETAKFQNPIIGLLYDWQTLVTGLFALFGAFLLWVQIRDQKRQFKLEREQVILEGKRENLAARIGLPHALAELTKYWQASFEAWKKEDPDSRPKPPPLGALKTVMEAAVLVDQETFRSMQELVIHAQAFEARVDTPKSERALNFFETMIFDIARLSYLTNRLYDFGRMRADKTPYVPPTREELERELYRDLGMYALPAGDPLNDRIRKAMDQEFGKKQDPNAKTGKTECLRAGGSARGGLRGLLAWLRAAPCRLWAYLR